MRAMILLAVLMLAGPPAWAAPEAGGIHVEVTPDPGGASGLMRGSVEIDATPEQVWEVLIDCAVAPKMVASLKSCRILERDPQGRWDVREQVSRAGPLPSVRSVFRSDYDRPRRITLPPHRRRPAGVRGRVAAGAALATARRVTYEAARPRPSPCPGWVARADPAPRRARRPAGPAARSYGARSAGKAAR